MQLTRALLGLCATVTFSAASYGQAATPGASSLGDVVQPTLGNGGYDVERYWLKMEFPDALDSYVATTTINARATQKLARFNLDLRGTTIQSVSVNGHPAKWTHPTDELVITPASPIARGAVFRVQVRVKGALTDLKPLLENQEAAAKFDLTAVLGLSRFGDWIQCMNQPASAHKFAAFADHPAQKAPAIVVISAPARLNSIANGELKAQWRDGENIVRRFESARKLAPELIQIGVGPFTVLQSDGPHGIKLRSAVPSDQVAAIEPQLARIPEFIAFLEKRLGPFPLQTYGIYAPLMGGELETQSLTLLRADQMSAPNYENNGVEGIVVHEIAHEYFGNSVSPRRWSDLWLNEGHAVYYEKLWAQESGKSSQEEFMKAAYKGENALMRSNGPIASPRGDAIKERDFAPYSPQAYAGGALVLYALRMEVGDETFERIERAWVKRYYDGVAGTADFIALASERSGRDLKPFLSAWLYGEVVPPMPKHPDWKSQNPSSGT